MEFNEAGGGHDVRGAVGPRAGQIGGALQAVCQIGHAGVADEPTAAAVLGDGEAGRRQARRIIPSNRIVVFLSD